MRNHLITLAVAVLISWLMLQAFQSPNQAAEKKESAYERVMRTGSIKCGYHIWEPFLMKDINSGQMSGIYYDYMQALGQILSLKIEWVEETGFGPHVEALKNDRFDMMCAGDYQNGARSRYIDYTTPILYITLAAFARADDARFDNNLSAMNDAAIRISSIEGTTPFIVANRDFPLAQKITHPESQDLTAPILDVATGKADITIAGLPLAFGFMEKNPGQIKQVPLPEPIRLFGSSLSLKRGEYDLQHMIDGATRELLYSGEIEKIMRKYEKYPSAFYRVAKPYQSPSAP